MKFALALVVALLTAFPAQAVEPEEILDDPVLFSISVDLCCSSSAASRFGE